MKEGGVIALTLVRGALREIAVIDLLAGNHWLTCSSWVK
jgi:hypothetical protein